MDKCIVVWLQRAGNEAFAHVNGSSVVWSKRRKGATEFTFAQARRFMRLFDNRQSLLHVTLPQGSYR